VNGSWGYLSIDGWDEPRAEVIVTKSTDRFYKPTREDEAKRRLDLIHVSVTHPSAAEVAITTTRPSRHGTWSPPLPAATKARVTVEYKVHVPHDTKLVIHHDTGYVWVSDIKGDVEATSATGDMIVMLPSPGQYAIDARCKMGGVYSELSGDALNQFLVGHHFVRPGEDPSHRIFLRMGRGNITLKRNEASWTPAN
jgi:hypothetical protein